MLSELSKLSADEMSKRMLGHGLDPDELLKDGSLVFNKGTETSMLLFLNEDLWTGDFPVSTTRPRARRAFNLIAGL
jgi:hypothetical protein